MVVIPAVTPTSSTHTEAETAPTGSCGQGYTYTKIDDIRWKCLTDEESQKVYDNKHKDDGTGVIIAILVIVILFIIGLMVIASI